MTFSQRLSLTLRLSFPAILAQLSSIVMQYIDAAMVGSLGAEASASIGLVASTTWLFSGLCSAVVAGFAVQVAHLLGAGENKSARSVLRQSITSTLIFSTVLAFIGVSISAKLPVWLGADPSIHEGSALYFKVYSLFLPVLQMNFLASGMLRYSGNMRIPSAAGVLMCLLDVIFNFFLIFPTREMHVFGSQVLVPGAGLGIEGAVIGTGLAQMVVAALLSWFLFTRGARAAAIRRMGQLLPYIKGHQARGANRIADGTGAHDDMRCADHDYGDSGPSRGLRDRGQFVRGHCGKPVLYARLRNRGCGGHPGRTEPRGEESEIGQELRIPDGRNGHGGNDLYGSAYVSVCSSNHRHNDSGRAN